MLRLDTKTFRFWLAAFFIALAAPAGVLVYQAYSQLKWEAFHQHRVLAEELADRIEDRFRAMIAREERRPFTDYAFLNVAGDPAASFVQRSPLSAYPPDTAPGLIGYFQVDGDGAFTTPLLPGADNDPASYGITGEDLERRQALAARMRRILDENRLVQSRESRLANESTAPSSVGSGSRDDVEKETMAAPATAFDQLTDSADEKRRQTKQKSTYRKLGRVEDLELDKRFRPEESEQAPQSAPAPSTPDAVQRSVRKEQSVLPEPQVLGKGEAAAREPVRITTFESEVDPLAFSVLDSGHFVLFRKVWREGERYVQGVLLAQQPFLRGMIEPVFRGTALSGMSDLAVAYQGEVFSVFSGPASRRYLSSAPALQGTLLHQGRLSAPLGDLELVFSVNRLPAGPGAAVIHWMTVTLVVVLCGGFYLMYRLGIGGIKLARQQQDFVSAVSHELKTPLTSIRMYGEMLHEGWVPEDKRRQYYAFIHDEGERLSRLINNILQLSRMSRNGPRPELRSMAVTELVDAIRSKASSQVERAGFSLRIDCDDAASPETVRVDLDLFTQIIINLVDNAVKFSAKAERKDIDIACHREPRGVRFSVRDYGPGVPKHQMKKIFTLFFRSENELTRETVGTGIGLALVDQFAKAMGAGVDVVNRDPGAEFSVRFDTVD